MRPHVTRPSLLVLVAASVAAILPATPAAATWNKQPEVFCIAIPDPKYVG